MSETVSFKDWQKLKIKVGKIISVEDHPNADKLVVMKIDVGEERTVVAGIKEHYSKDDLVGKKVAVFVNLEPAVLRGVKSEGMVLAAVDGDNVVLLSPEEDIKTGSRVS